MNLISKTTPKGAKHAVSCAAPCGSRCPIGSPIFDFLIFFCLILFFIFKTSVTSSAAAAATTTSSSSSATTAMVHSGLNSNNRGFGFCGGMPSSGQALTAVQKKKAMSLLHTKNTDTNSIKNNCMDCHTMVNLVSSMNAKDRKKWFKGIKYLREVIKNMTRQDSGAQNN